MIDYQPWKDLCCGWNEQELEPAKTWFQIYDILFTSHVA